MALTPRETHSYPHYHDMNFSGNSRVQFGDTHHHGQSSDERAMNAILESLSYTGMTSRRDALAEAHEGTFDWTFLNGDHNFLSKRWIINAEESKDLVRSVEMNFNSWLCEDGGGLFCFTGKPGAGKSTLMKSLASNANVENALKSWSKDGPLVRTDHYFWILGEPVQKSIEGLLRNLLHSILCCLSRLETSQCYAAVKEVCGPRWMSMNNRGPWSRAELKRMITHLASLPTMRCMFFIDALDECEPQDALGELADEILWMSRLPNVKLCVSCRPWNAFVRKFDPNTTLRIDSLTYSDMAKCIEERLIDAEAQCDLQDDFRLGTQAAKELVYGVADAAEGVFLWIELVTKALCSELRKGRSTSQLHRIIRDFPTDLDSYFDKLIFNRIGKTQSNIRDTAAALKLALEIHRHEERGEISIPYPRNSMNFWLLCRGHLRRGFSWIDHESIEQFPVERMMIGITSFLEETCKDLLVPVKTKSQDYGWDITFLHRTVYDFLNDSPMSLPLERDAPEHFSDPAFIAELARLRCLCLIRQKPADCHLGRDCLREVLSSDLPYDEYSSPGWLTTCENITITHMRANCICLGLDHLLPRERMISSCVQAGRSGYLEEVMKNLPHLALLHNHSGRDVLDHCLLLQGHDKTQAALLSRLSILREALECGCNPNTPQAPMISCCLRTRWEYWLVKTYWGLQNSDRSIQEIQLQKCANGAIARLLLEYGADPHCKPCIEPRHKHMSEDQTREKVPCHPVVLSNLLPLLVLPESLAEIADVLAACSDEVATSKLRREQCRRTLRSLVSSEQSLASCIADGVTYYWEQKPSPAVQWKREQKQVLRSLTGLRSGLMAPSTACFSCSGKDLWKAFLLWCIDCRGTSYLCHDCCKVLSPKTREFGNPCSASQGLHGAEGNGHMSIIVALDDLWKDSHIRRKDVKDNLISRYSVAQAITVLKEWSARNPT